MKKTALLFAVLICLASVSAANADAFAAEISATDSGVPAKVCIEESIRKRLPELSLKKKVCTTRRFGDSRSAWHSTCTPAVASVHMAYVPVCNFIQFFNSNPVDKILYLRE